MQPAVPPELGAAAMEVSRVDSRLRRLLKDILLAPLLDPLAAPEELEPDPASCRMAAAGLTAQDEPCQPKLQKQWPCAHTPWPLQDSVAPEEDTTLPGHPRYMLQALPENPGSQ